MKTIKLFGFIFMLSYFSGQAQINLVGASINAGTGQIDIVKWQAFDSASVTPYPTMFVGYYMASSLFDAYNSNYYLTGLTPDSSALLSFNTISNDTSLHPFNSYSNTYETGFVPGTVSEIVCDNHAFAQNAYGIVSIDEKDKPDVSIFPNPATNKFTLQVKGFEDNFIVKIYNLNGRECFSREIHNPETEISTEFLTKGVYFVTLQNQKVLETHKLVIQ
jgi:hypothetical protein